MTNFENGKILVKKGTSFGKIERTLLNAGYSWVNPGKLEEGRSLVRSVFFYEDGSIKHSTMTGQDKDWEKHANPEYHIPFTMLVLKDQWVRGDIGPAPIDYIFEGTPPTEIEAPGGYLTSACGTKFQRLEAGMLHGGVRIVIEPNMSKLEVFITKKVRQDDRTENQ